MDQDFIYWACHLFLLTIQPRLWYGLVDVNGRRIHDLYQLIEAIERGEWPVEAEARAKLSTGQ